MDEITPQRRDVTLVELLDRVVDHGVVLSGDITISVADVDLIYLGLRVLLRTPLTAGPTTHNAPRSGTAEEPDDFLLRLRDSGSRE